MELKKITMNLKKIMNLVKKKKKFMISDIIILLNII